MASTIETPKPLETLALHAVPPATRHAITINMPMWADAMEFAENASTPEFQARMASVYPRIFPHKDVKELNMFIVKKLNLEGKYCLLFPNHRIADVCRQWITQPNRPDKLESVPADVVSIRNLKIKVRLFAVIVPLENVKQVMPFLIQTGTGISTRLGEMCLKHVDDFAELPEDDHADSDLESPAHQELKDDITSLLKRSPIVGSNAAAVTSDDVYLFQTGMAAIYYAHCFLQDWSRPTGKTIMLGFPFHHTILLFENFGPGVEWMPLGTELDRVEQFCQSEASKGHPVRAVFTEFPSNPLLVSSDLYKLRELANTYGFALIVDETVASFCNVDVLPVADVIVSSLTKAYSGYADVMGGSAVLCPQSPIYPALKNVFKQNFQNDLHPLDAEALVRNGRDFLPRSTKLNNNAASLVDYLHSLTGQPDSVVTKLFYPTVAPTRANYDAVLRPATPDFTPGYGCLFSVELATEEAAIAFYDHLYVHGGPHLGAHRTLAVPYVKVLFGKKLEEVEPSGMRVSQVRISVGLEDTDELIRTFKFAVQKAAEALPDRAGAAANPS